MEDRPTQQDGEQDREQGREQNRRNYVPPRPGGLYVLGWVVAMLVVLVVTVGLVLGRDYWIQHQTAELQRQYGQGRRVLVVRVTTAPQTRRITLPGTIHGYVETAIYAKVAGYLKAIKVDKGDRVRKGQILALLESPELDQQVANARASYNLKAVTDKRNRELVRHGVIAQQAADESHAGMLQARAVLDQLLAMQAYEVIRAPFSGVITARYVDPGALIPEATTPSTAATPIVAMATVDKLRIYADFPQRYAPFIRDGDPAEVTVTEYPGRHFKGEVTRHPDALNAATRTMRVEVDMGNPEGALLPGMYATIHFTVSTPEGVPTVPDDALIFRNGKVYLPLVRDNRIRLAEVTLGYDNGQNVEVTSGVKPDEIVAINVGQAARDGEPVQPVFANSRGL